jgi:murein DD-endopeptidase MepM/ murein hydrolase activator NlpD
MTYHFAPLLGLRSYRFRNVVIGAFLLAQSAFGQCAISYSDASSDGTNMQAWSQMTDYYTDTGGCAPAWGSFTHSYRQTVTIISPTGRSTVGYGSGQQTGGAGPGYSSAAQSLPIYDEFLDPWTIQTHDEIDCSVAGPDYYNFVDSFQRTPSQHSYPNSPWYAVGCRIAADFDRITNAGRRHGAQDVSQTGLQYGAAAYAMETGTVVRCVNTNGPAAVGYPQCEGQGYPPNFVELRGNDGYLTRYVHVRRDACIIGEVLYPGQLVGVIDNSGCVSGPHTHIGRYDALSRAVNFTIQTCTYPNRPNANILHDAYLGDPY